MANVSEILLQDEFFIRKNSLQCNLFLQVEKDISKILISDEEGKIHNLEIFKSNEFLAKKWPFINLKFSTTTIVTLPESFVLVPEEFGPVEEQDNLRSFFHSSDSILNKKIDNLPIYTYFTINETTTNFQKLLAKSKVLPSSNPLIQQAFSLSNEHAELIVINFHPNDFELVFIKNNKLILYNHFPKENADDFNYFILTLFNQFQIKPAQTSFHLGGMINKTNECYVRLNKYTSLINFMSPPDHQTLHSIPIEIITQFNLLINILNADNRRKIEGN